MSSAGGARGPAWREAPGSPVTEIAGRLDPARGMQLLRLLRSRPPGGTGRDGPARSVDAAPGPDFPVAEVSHAGRRWREVTAWVRTPDGWALNLDGSDAARVFSLPRLEVRSTAQGWRSLCLMPDGTVRDRPEGTAFSVAAAKAGALEQAGRMLGPVQASALAALLAATG